MPLLTRWSNSRTSFQFKLFSIFTLLTAAISLLLSTLYVTIEIKEKRAAAHENVLLLAQQLAESVRLPLYAENRGVLQQVAEQTAQKPEICAVVIRATDGTVLADIRRPGCSDSSNLITQTVAVFSSQLMDSVESSMTGRRDSGGALVGSVRIERGTADLSRASRKVVLLAAISAIFFWLMVSLLCFFVLRRVTRSFNALIQGINILQEGDFTARINVISDDEPGRAAQAVNCLAAALQQRELDNKRLHEERLELERQILNAQKLESLGVMAGGIAHDFNNLLQAISGNMELALKEMLPDPKPQKYLATAMKSCTHAAYLTGLLLSYVGKGFFVKKELNLNELVRDNVDMLRTATTSAVSTELRLAVNLPAIMADKAQLQQVVMNLITNAAESIERQPGLITVTTGIQSCDRSLLDGSLTAENLEPGSYVFLEVSDNGCGMSGETLQRIFEPFYTTKFTGRGLGMSAVMGIVKTHGGALLVDSEPGRGTAFKVLFPVIESAWQGSTPPQLQHFELSTLLPAQTPLEMEEAKADHEQVTNQLTSLSGMVLVVDDEKAVLKVCKKMVNLCGLTAVTACDGIEAVSRYREDSDKFVLVLMDLTMPNMDGMTAMNEIFSIRPDAKVIIASGYSEDELSECIADQQPSGFIRKPYSMSVLEAEIRRVLLGQS